MEQVGAREQVQYASLSWRFAAIAVDTMVLFFLLVVIFAVLVVAAWIAGIDFVLTRVTESIAGGRGVR